MAHENDQNDAHGREYLAAAEGMADLYGRRLEPEQSDQPAGLADEYGRVWTVGQSLTWARAGWPPGLTLTTPIIAIEGGRYVVSDDGQTYYVEPTEVMPL